MKNALLRFLLIAAFLFAPAGFSTVLADSDAPEVQDGEQQLQEETQLRRRRRVRNLFPSAGDADVYQRDHSTVKSAFRTVVSEPAKSTVIVLAKQKQVGLGTVVTSDGYVLTKGSELKDSLMCQFGDGSRLVATVVGIHDETDLAMLKVDANGLTPIQWRDSEPPAVGEWLATPGLEMDPLSIGVVSVGPRRISAPSGILGILLEQGEGGPRIDQVLPDSGAEKAGLQVNDVVLSVNGELMKSRDHLISTVQKFKPGDSIRLSVRRGDETMSMTATLGDRSVFGPGSERQNFQNTLGGGLSERRAGFPSVLQHDTVLRPRECGGPIVDLDGKAVGINIARAGRVSSFALPTSVVQGLLPDFLAGKFSPELTTRKQLDDLNAKADALRATKAALTEKVAELEATAEAEEIVERAKVELKVVQDELKSVEMNKAVLQQSLAEKQ